MKTVSQLIRYADASGHEHVGKGVPEGGQFAKSPHALASSLSGYRGDEKQPAKTISVEDMANYLVDNGLLGSEDEIDSPEGQAKVASMYAKAKGGASATPAAPSDRSQKPGQREPGKLTAGGTYHNGFMPQAGQTASYYDGEGGGSRDKPLTGKILAVNPQAASGNTVQVLSRTGSPVWIPAEATMPAQ